MNTLIIKLGATGDVVRTTTLLRRFSGPVTWLTAAKNTVFVAGLTPAVRCFAWEQREQARDPVYDLVINLEDTLDVAQFLQTVKHKRLFGAYAKADDALHYTADSRRWFDLGLISLHGRAQADRLKWLNRHSYQELLFDGLGFRFAGEPYCLPQTTATGLAGDIALATEAGPVWPMKKWAYYAELKAQLEARGFMVNVLPTRPTLLEHLADVRGHRVLVGGDTLPMHLALGSGVRCVSLFTCTSPWEIHDYGLQTKIISPLLEEFFYQRAFETRATTAISLEEVLAATLRQCELAGLPSPDARQLTDPGIRHAPPPPEDSLSASTGERAG